MYVCMYVCIYIPRGGIARSDCSSIFNFLRNIQTVAQFTFSPTVRKGSLLCKSSPTLTPSLFDDSHTTGMR